MTALVDAVRESIAEAEARKAAVEVELEALREIEAIASTRLNGGGMSNASVPASRPAAPRAADAAAGASSQPRQRSSRPARTKPPKGANGRRERKASVGAGQSAAPAERRDRRLEILRLLELRGEIRQADIGEACGMSSGGVTMAVKALEAAGKVTRRKDENGKLLVRLPDARDREQSADPPVPGPADRDALKEQLLEVLAGGPLQGVDLYARLDPKPTDTFLRSTLAELMKDGKVEKRHVDGRPVLCLAGAETPSPRATGTEELILRKLEELGPLNKAEISHELKLPAADVDDAIDALLVDRRINQFKRPGEPKPVYQYVEG